MTIKPLVRTKAFHPGTMGVMHWCVVIKTHSDDTVTVIFDQPYPGSNKKTFRLPVGHLQGEK